MEETKIRKLLKKYGAEDNEIENFMQDLADFKEDIEELLTQDDFKEIVLNQIKRAKTFDKSFEVLRDTMGQKPTDKVELESDKPFEVNIKVIK